MKFLLIILCLLPVGGKASGPDWFSDYVKSNPGCEREFLCAVGDGETLADALAEARSEVAKFFQTKVKSKSLISSSSQQFGNTAASGTFDEWTNKTVSEETSELISGLEIKKQEQVGSHTYVLMTLDRNKTAKLLKEKIDELDSINAKAFELNSRFTFPKILKNLALIEAYRERYSLVTEVPLILKVKTDLVLGKINKLKPLKMAMVTKGRKLPSKLSHTLIDTLSPLKIVIVPKKNSPKYTLRSELFTEEEYFNVEGFKKMNVTLRLELLNSDSIVMGKMSALSEQVARNAEQAIEKAAPEIKESFQDNLDQLTNVKMED